MERASKNLLFATTIVLFYPLEMVRQSFLDEEYGQEKGVQSLNVWGYLCALKDVFEKHNELVLEKHRESCDWKTQSIMCLKITSFHVTIVNYVDEACIHWNRVKYIQFMFFYTPLYSLMV